MLLYYVIGEWLIEEHDNYCWIYKKDNCYCRIPIHKYKTVEELKEILERFLIVIGEFYE